MRIASYNIMSGGFDAYTSTASTPQRLPLLQKAIKKLDADILGLIDTFRWDEIYTSADLKKLFDYKYVYIINLDDERLKLIGHNNGLTLLSNSEITALYTVRIATRNAIFAQVQHGTGQFNLVIAYLDDMSEDTRLEQLHALRSQLNLKEPLLIMGDLNTVKNSDATRTKMLLDEFYTQNPAAQEKLTPVINEMLQGEVVDLLESWNLQDAGQEQSSPTVPTPLFPAKVKQPFLRLDYCFHSPSLPVSRFEVPYDKVFKEASDHFPILFNLG